MTLGKPWDGYNYVQTNNKRSSIITTIVFAFFTTYEGQKGRGQSIK